jgi:alkanesulfonate monooxygenase SsuD/methylene tetrahydromethanopterin reductase-like flavin-dependent oxidoreductase (luciferase family)
MNLEPLRERHLEAHDLVMKAWQEADTFAFNGRFNQQRYVNIWPRPVQRPHPPVWIPGGGSIETWQWCARMDYVYAYLSYFGYKDGKATMDGFWAEMSRLGKDRNPYRAGFLQFVGVAESREKAMELYREGYICGVAAYRLAGRPRQLRHRRHHARAWKSGGPRRTLARARTHATRRGWRTSSSAATSSSVRRTRWWSSSPRWRHR